MANNTNIMQRGVASYFGNKAHIFKIGKTWWCSGKNRVASGFSYKEAYLNWLKTN